MLTRLREQHMAIGVSSIGFEAEGHHGEIFSCAHGHRPNWQDRPMSEWRHEWCPRVDIGVDTVEPNEGAAHIIEHVDLALPSRENIAESRAIPPRVASA